MTDLEIIKVLQRLEQQTKVAIDLVRAGSMRHDPSIRQTPNTFTVGDFVVTDKHWVSCQSCTPKSNEP